MMEMVVVIDVDDDDVRQGPKVHQADLEWSDWDTPITGLLTDADADGTLWNCFRAYCFLALSLAAKEWNRLKREMDDSQN